MYFLLITILGVASLSLLPVKTLGTTEVQETPQALPLIAQTQPTTNAKNDVDNVSRYTGGEIWQEDDREVLIRNERGTKQNNNGGNGNNGAAAPTCRYVKSAWTECDQKTNMRTRTLTLRKGDGCDLTKTIEKKCKKACRYEKGSWSECTGGQISRTDKLKSTSDSTCLATRVINKNCNNGKSKDKSNKERKNKDKGARKGRA